MTSTQKYVPFTSRIKLKYGLKVMDYALLCLLIHQIMDRLEIALFSLK